MSNLGSAGVVRLAAAIVGLTLVASAAAGCSTRASYSVSVEQLLASGEEGHGLVKVAGLISTEPTRSGDGTVFFMQDERDSSKRVAVVYSERELPSVPKDQGPKGYVDRLVIVRGDFDGRVVESEDLLLKQYGTYGQ